MRLLFAPLQDVRDVKIKDEYLAPNKKVEAVELSPNMDYPQA